MGKSFRNRHATVAFFMQSVTILTPTGVNKRQCYNNFKNHVRFCYTTVVKLSCLRLLGTDKGTDSSRTNHTYVNRRQFRSQQA